MTCKLSAIVAVCDDWGIGCEGDMVVSNRADMRHFVACTKGCPVIMGRKTLLSFPGGRPLKNRRNIVLTRDESFAAEGVDVVHGVDEALVAVADEPVAWVIGGGEVYRQFLPYCVEAEVTHNHCVHDVDTYFPDLDADPWQCFCDHCCKTAVRWTWTELYEPGSCRKMFPYDLFCRKND